MVTVSTAAFYERSSMGIASLRKRAEALQTAIGSGERIDRASDDPVGASQLRSLGRADAFAAIDRGNAARASSDLTLADSALSNFSAYVIRVKELATQAANGILTPQQRGGIVAEIEQIHAELVHLANTRDSAGHALFGGQTAGAAYAIDAAGNVTYTGTASAGELPLGEGQNVTRGVTGPEFLNFTGPAGATSLFATVKDLAAALAGASADPAQAARDAMGTLDAGLESITTVQTVVGARLGWIDLLSERRTEMGELRDAEQADIGGTDLAATVTELQQVMTVLEASQASFARLASLSLFDLLR